MVKCQRLYTSPIRIGSSVQYVRDVRILLTHPVLRYAHKACHAEGEADGDGDAPGEVMGEVDGEVIGEVVTFPPVPPVPPVGLVPGVVDTCGLVLVFGDVEG